MKHPMQRSSLALVSVTLLAAFAMGLLAQAQTQSQPPSPAKSRSEEMLDRWNDIGNKLVAMAKDFPEDKYDYKLQKDQRTFALNLLHAAALDFVLIRRISGSNLGPDFGDGDNPTRDAFKTKVDVGKFVQEAVADGAQVIHQQGDAGLDHTSKFFGNQHLDVRHRAQLRALWPAGGLLSREQSGATGLAPLMLIACTSVRPPSGCSAG